MVVCVCLCVCLSFCVSTKLKTTFEHCLVHFYMLNQLYSPPEVLLDSRACSIEGPLDVYRKKFRKLFMTKTIKN